ncbi:uncharacterized protein ACBR49_000708 [Aulostomus maculatus]
MAPIKQEENKAKRKKSFIEQAIDKREKDKRLGATRVILGDSFARWRSLKESKGLATDAQVAAFLLDSYDMYTKSLPASIPVKIESDLEPPDPPSLPSNSADSQSYDMYTKSLPALTPVKIESDLEPPDPPLLPSNSADSQSFEEASFTVKPCKEETVIPSPLLPVTSVCSRSLSEGANLPKQRIEEPENTSTVEEVEVSIDWDDKPSSEDYWEDKPLSEDDWEDRPSSEEDWEDKPSSEDNWEDKPLSEDDDTEDMSSVEEGVSEELDSDDPEYAPRICVRASTAVEVLRTRVNRGNENTENGTDEKPEEKSEEPKPSQEPRRAQKSVNCPTCGRVFPHNSSLKRHLVIHSGKRPFKCFICGRGFTQSGNLKTHMKTHKEEASKWMLHKEKSAPKESPVTVHVCGECGMDFPQKEQLEEHHEVHKKPYVCSECGRAFKIEDNLKRHKRIHSGESLFICSECGKHFLTAITLKTHKLTHTGEKNFKCNQCGKAFSQVCHLNVHLRTHTGERPYLCAICGKSYSRVGALKVHLRVHTGEKPYTCDTCGKSFYYYHGYKAHLMIHNKKPKPQTKPLGRPKQQVGEPSATSSGEFLAVVLDWKPFRYTARQSRSESGGGKMLNSIKQEPCATERVEDKRQEKVLSEVQKQKKKLLDLKRAKTRIDIGESFQRWKEVRERTGMKSDAEVALFLIDNYEKETSTSKSLPLPPGSNVSSLSGRDESSDNGVGEPLSAVKDGSDWEDDTWSEDEDEDEEAVSEEAETDDPDYTPGSNGQVSNKKSRKVPKTSSSDEQQHQEKLQWTRQPKKVFECPTCRRVFPRNCALQRHLVIHSGKRPFKCFICGRGFTQGGNLKTHMKTHKGESNLTLVEEKSAPKESPVTAHVCGECGMDFPQKEQLEEHRETHKKPYACPECGKRFKVKEYLKIHDRVHTGDSPYVCLECGKRFLTAITLKKHELTHTGEKNFHCDQCGRAFSQVSHLKVHLRTHSGERPHLCAVCGKSYSRSGTLKVHLRVHTGEKPYTCDKCGKSFYYFQGYRAHVMIHDKKPKPPTKPLGRPKQQSVE